LLARAGADLGFAVDGAEVPAYELLAFVDVSADCAVSSETECFGLLPEGFFRMLFGADMGVMNE